MPSLRHRRLARELREIRKSLGLGIEDVASELGWAGSKLSRIETARAKPKVSDVEQLLALYGVTSPELDALIQLAKDASKRGWWTAFGDVFDGTYVGFEDQAAAIYDWEPCLIPGLLQTEAYARAVISAVRLTGPEGQVRHRDPEEVEKRVRARRARQPLLSRDVNPPHLHTVVSEGALRQQVGGPEVMRAQLAELWSSSSRPNITVQVVPFAACAHPGVDGSFVILEFADPADQDLMYVESQAGDVYVESAEQHQRLRLAWEGICDAALTPEESQRFLRDLLEE